MKIPDVVLAHPEFFYSCGNGEEKGNCIATGERSRYNEEKLEM